MKTFGKLVVALGITAMMGSTAHAQGRGGFGMMGGGMLLRNKSVQQELKVSDDQASKLNALAEETQAKMRETFQGLQNASQEERQEKMQALQADVNKGLADILKPEQVKRYHQIQAQAAGPMAFGNPRVANALKLTDDQKEKIRTIGQEMRDSMPSREDFQNDREAAMKKMAEARKEATEKAVGVLTSEQKATWKDLTGEPFEVKFERPNN